MGRKVWVLELMFLVGCAGVVFAMWHHARGVFPLSYTPHGYCYVDGGYDRTHPYVVFRSHDQSGALSVDVNGTVIDARKVIEGLDEYWYLAPEYETAIVRRSDDTVHLFDPSDAVPLRVYSEGMVCVGFTLVGSVEGSNFEPAAAFGL